MDIDSLLRPVYGHHKQGASFGHAKIAGRALLRKGLSPLITTLSTATAAPVIAEARLRSGKAGSGRGAARQVKQAIGTARACGGSGKIMLRGDSAFGTKKVIATCLDEQRRVLADGEPQQRRVSAAIEAIDEAAYTPVHYPGAVLDPDTGALISDAEVAETPYTLRVRAAAARSPPGWWCAGSKTPATPTRCFRCGAITRFSPTPTCPPPRPTSPTAATPSSRPPSPT